MTNNITKQEYKKALENRKIYIVGSKYTSNGWTKYRVYILKKSKLTKSFGLEPVMVKCAYNKDGGAVYHCVAWGTSRKLEVILSIGYALGLKFDEISQRYISL